MKPSPPSATMMSACSGDTPPYRPLSSASAFCASGASLAAKPMERSAVTVFGSAAGDAHMARHRRRRMTAVDDEVVALGLARDRFADCRFQRRIAFRGAQRRAQVGGVLLAETHIKRAGAG